MRLIEVPYTRGKTHVLVHEFPDKNGGQQMNSKYIYSDLHMS